MLIEFFVRRPIFAAVCSIVIVLMGAVSIGILPIDYYPQVTPPAVTVTTNYPGASAEEVESAVTNILERQINGVKGSRYISSVSTSDGTSQITVTLDRTRNVDDAAVDIQSRLSQAQGQLPAEVIQNGIAVTKSGTTSFVQFISLSSMESEYNTLFLSNYVDLYIRDALRRIPGVSDVEIFGERRYAMRVWLDPGKLAAQGLTTQDVINAVREQNTQVSAGQIGRPPVTSEQLYQFTVRVVGRLVKPEEFETIILKTQPNGAIIHVQDVGRVELGAESYDTSFKIDGIDSIGIGINKLTEANALDIARAVRQKMEELKRDFPPGMVYRIPYDTTLFVNESIQEVAKALIESIGLVVIVLFIFLQNWQVTLIPTITIPVSLIGTFTFMYLLGFSINTLTMFGLTLSTGLVVDDTIVVVENISRYIQEEGIPPVQAAIRGMKEVFAAVIATTLALVALFLPVAFFPGTSGQIYRQFALTIVVSVCLSTFNAITLAPPLAAILIRRQEGKPFILIQLLNIVLDGIRDLYSFVLRVLVRIRVLVLAGFFVALWAAYALFQFVPKGFIPTEDQGYFITFIQGPPGVSLNFTEQVIQQATGILQSIPEIESTVSVGGFSFAGASPGNALIFSTLKPWSQRQQLASGIVNTLRGPFLGGISRSLVIPIEPPSIQGLGTADGFQFQLQDRALNDLNALEQVSKAFFGVTLAPPAPNQPRLPIAINPPGFSANTPQLLVKVNRDKAQLLRVNLADIFGTLQTFLGGTYVNNFDDLNRNYRVYVQADHAFRDNPEDINQFYVRSQIDELIPLKSLVTFSEVASPQIINHYNLFRSVEIQGSALPGFSSGQAIQAMEGLAAKLLPQGMGYEWTGISLEELESGGQTGLIFGLGVVFVFLVLAAQFESFVDPLIILLVVPLAVLGALSAQLWRGLSNDIFCQVGLVMLVGLASKNSILIVEFANQLHHQGLPVVKAALQASALRFRAILMTALSTLMGIYPLLVATGAGAASRQSLGTAVFGGMLVATLLSLGLIPVLYIIIKQTENWLLHKKIPND
jgi:HAE1 family hydrophobic/amphiphilic exporter-1